MITDDPGTPGDGHWEFNILWNYEHAAGAAESEAPLLDFAYGIGERLQLKYEVPWVVVDGVGSTLGNSSIGAKWRFVDSGDRGWRVSTYPQFEFNYPGSDAAERGLAQPGHSYSLPLEFERGFENFTLGLEVGRAFSSRDEDQWFGGVVLLRELAPGFEAQLELHGDSSVGFGRTTVTANVGAVWALAEHGALVFSVGRDFHDALNGGKRTIATLGWQISH